MLLYVKGVFHFVTRYWDELWEEILDEQVQVGTLESQMSICNHQRPSDL